MTLSSLIQTLADAALQQPPWIAFSNRFWPWRIPPFRLDSPWSASSTSPLSSLIKIVSSTVPLASHLLSWMLQPNPRVNSRLLIIHSLGPLLLISLSRWVTISDIEPRSLFMRNWKSIFLLMHY